jgi:hypothetical protein
MSKSKKLFVAGVVVFVLGIAYFSYDVSKRTTFPGSKPQLQERIKERFLEKDSLVIDSIKTEP